MGGFDPMVRSHSRTLSAFAVSSAALLASCAGILGIEDIQVNPGSEDAGSGGETADDDAGSGGAGNSGGGTGDGGSKVGAGGGGQSSGGKGAGGGAAGGAGDGGGGPVDGGAGGSSDGGAITVNGKIIDAWKHAVPNAEVTIGDT